MINLQETTIIHAMVLSISNTPEVFLAAFLWLHESRKKAAEKTFMKNARVKNC